tara:strand:+ start:1010 stop:1396 length:387 start_codon:yes stop_codon:yes gene_type:complete
MAYTVRNLKDTDFETVVHVTITGTNATATEIVDASGLAGASTDPRLSIVSCTWSVSSTLEVEFHATSNVTALTLNGNGNFNIGSQQLPPITNNAGSGVSGDIHLENDAACVGFIILKLRKVSGYNNIT